MEFRDDYVKRFNKNVEPHDFQKGMLVFLHSPEKLQINPKLQSPWFGPYVILEMFGTHNSLIQELSNKKTKFVNVNRLRKYDNSIRDWNDFKLTKIKKKKSAKLQNSDSTTSDPETACAHKDAHAEHAPAMAEFSADNDITILNPWVRPIPGSPRSIKSEPLEISGALSSEQSNYEDTLQEFSTLSPTPPNSNSPEPGTSSGRTKLPSVTDTLKDIFLPSGTRKSSRNQGNILPSKDFREIEKELKAAEKAGKISKTKKK